MSFCLNLQESQGFIRTNSSSKLTYNFDKKSQNEELDEHSTQKENKINEKETPPSEKEVKKLLPKPVEKQKTRSNAIANKASLFESSPCSNAKDPALLSIMERKALFEKNQGAALLPKAPFGMSAPVAQKPKLVPKTIKPLKDINTTPKTTKSNTSKQNSPVKAAIAQSGGIASKMAALLQNKTTISQEQIENNIKKQRQKEMEVLVNRFNKNKAVSPNNNRIKLHLYTSK